MHIRNAFSVTILCLSSMIWAQSAAQTSADRTSKVSGSGCVEAGIEAGCLVLHDLHSGTNFNLLFKDNPPKINTAIEFEGTENNNPNTCMQGKAVDVSKWTQIRLEGPQPETSESTNPVPALSRGLEIEYKAFARFVQGDQGVLFLTATCFYKNSGMKIFFVEESGQFKLMQQPPTGHFSHLATYYVATWPRISFPGKIALPTDVTIVDAYGEHKVHVLRQP
jgi:hypothetical protein